MRRFIIIFLLIKFSKAYSPNFSDDMVRKNYTKKLVVM
jgi:hypothetical protein